MPGPPQWNLFVGNSPLSGSGRRALLVLSYCALVAFPCLCHADTIYLKNGRKVVAESTRTDGKLVVFLRGENEISIPLSLVDRIERSELPPARRASDTGVAEDLPLPPPPEFEAEPEGDAGVVKENAVDEAALLSLDNDVLRNPSVKNRHLLSQGYQEAAVFLTRAGDAEGAIAKYRHALKFAPNDMALTLSLGYLLVTQSHHNEAIELLLPAATRHPRSPDIPMLLGSAYYASENLDRRMEQGPGHPG